MTSDNYVEIISQMKFGMKFEVDLRLNLNELPVSRGMDLHLNIPIDFIVSATEGCWYSTTSGVEMCWSYCRYSGDATEKDSIG